MLIEKIRLNKLKLLVEEEGSIASLASAIDTSPAYISQILNGVVSSSGTPRQVGSKLARKIEKALNKPEGWMDQIEVQLQKDRPPTTVNLTVSTRDSVDIPLLAAKGSMGDGNETPDPDLVVDVLRITKPWLDKTLTSVSDLTNLRFIHAIGDSMMPTFNDGDILLVDAGTASIAVDGVYVLSAHDRLFIKRVRRRLDGQFEISSDNISVKTVDVLNGDHEVQVKGRVVWVWNGKRV